jgi:hypothetical protein
MRPRQNAARYPSQHPSYRPKIPIVDGHRQVVGWSDEGPQLKGLSLRHPEAESLLGGPISCGFIELQGEDAVVAGAPPTWRGPWRCIAIIDERAPIKSLSADPATGCHS